MATPAFIYAFDNLGPDRFTELCGILLGSRYKGFLLGGIGADGGVDGEFDERLGVLHAEAKVSLLTDIVQPGQIVVFQFKHKTTARSGQASSRSSLLDLYGCKKNKKCELHRSLITSKQPTSYVLVTNVEVNAPFRTDFIEKCKAENPAIQHYQVIGLDELESWVKMEKELGHLYFPTIFGSPQFDLRVHVEPISVPGPMGPTLESMFRISVLNVGTVSSYVDQIQFQLTAHEEVNSYMPSETNNEILLRINPQPGTPVAPGRKQVYYYSVEEVGMHLSAYIHGSGLDRLIPRSLNNAFFVEVRVCDEIGNEYRANIPDILITAMSLSESHIILSSCPHISGRQIPIKRSLPVLDARVIHRLKTLSVEDSTFG